MAKTAAITIRLPEGLKKRFEQRARRERRSLSAQVLRDLELIAANEDEMVSGSGRFLGRYEGGKLPGDGDLREVRSRLWRRLSGEKKRRG